MSASSMHEAKPRSWARFWPVEEEFISTAARGRVRLRTLSNLRWLAIAGQSATLFVVYFGLGYSLPLWRCIGVIAASALLNLLLTVRYEASHRLTNLEATVHLAYDVLQLAALLYLTGGIANPFSLMFLGPVVIAATTLNLSNTMILGAIAFFAITLIGVVHEPLPWAPHEALRLPQLYVGGIWASLVIGIGFTTIYAWRIARESARMSAGLAATQLALAREKRLASIGALATAAAHELGTPLGTIAVVAHELERALPPNSPEVEDIRLLRAEAERCRGILTTLARPERSVIEATQRMALGAVLDDIAAEYRSEDLEIRIETEEGHGPEPKIWRVPELIHGLGNFIANAADFAETTVVVRTGWTDKDLHLSVEDDGPGFAPEILERIGEPYVTSRPGSYALGQTELEPSEAFSGQQGMGLGFFIAKTLIEQTGGRVHALNRPEGGAAVSVRWARGAIDGEKPPATGGAL
jgi:two-component system, sensor histidine kinase RegB